MLMAQYGKEVVHPPGRFSLVLPSEQAVALVDFALAFLIKAKYNKGANICSIYVWRKK
jgi:hypothetical protein